MNKQILVGGAALVMLLAAWGGALKGIADLNGSQFGTGYPFPVAPSPTTPTIQTGGTVTTGGTFQTVLPANPARTSCLIPNTSADIAYVYWLPGGTPTQFNSLPIKPGGAFSCINPSGAPIRTAIQWMTSTTGDTFVVTENQ